MDALDQVIDQQLADISTKEIAGAYRSICGMMLVQTVVAFRKGAIHRNEDAEAKRWARKWVEGEAGTISFAECCEVLNLDIERARRAIQSVVPCGRGRSINRLVAGV